MSVAGRPVPVHHVFDEAMKTRDKFQFIDQLDVHHGADQTSHMATLGELLPYDVYDQKYIVGHSIVEG